MVKPAAEPGPIRLTWSLWQTALRALQEFQEKYEGVEAGVGIRFNFEILVTTNNRHIDGQFAVGKGVLDMI